MISVNCEFCGKNFEPKRSTAKFCSDNCRVKFNKNPETVFTKRVILVPDKDGFWQTVDGKRCSLIWEDDPPKPAKKFHYVEGVDMEIKQSDKPVTATVTITSKEGPPIRMEGEDAFDFAARKNAWKITQGK